MGLNSNKNKVEKSKLLDQLIEIRKLKKTKQVDVAYYIGVSKTTMSRFESGKYEMSTKKLEKYAEYLEYEIRLLKK